jgi:hypothetical protein
MQRARELTPQRALELTPQRALELTMQSAAAFYNLAMRTAIAVS